MSVAVLDKRRPVWRIVELKCAKCKGGGIAIIHREQAERMLRCPGCDKLGAFAVETLSTQDVPYRTAERMWSEAERKAERIEAFNRQQRRLPVGDRMRKSQLDIKLEDEASSLDITEAMLDEFRRWMAIAHGIPTRFLLGRSIEPFDELRRKAQNKLKARAERRKARARRKRRRGW